MKYCTKCGRQLTENTKFCTNCGTKIKLENISEKTSQTVAVEENKKKKRVALMVLAIIFFFFAAIMLLGVLADGIEHIFSMLFFGILGAMFFCLSKTPKKSKYLFGKSNGLTKTLFIVISLIISIVIVMISPETPTQDDPSQDISVEKNNEDVSNKKSETVPIEETVITVDKLKLLVEVTVENEEYYTPNTFAVYARALEEANYIIVNGADTQNDVDVVAECLESSIANLQKRADKTELQTKIEEAKAIEVSTYLPATVSVLQNAIKDAESTNEDINAAEQNVKQAIVSINNAISGLETPPDKSVLVAKLEEATKIEVSAYEPKTVTDLNTAIKSGEDVVTDINARSVDVSNAISSIEHAIASLELLPDKTQLEALIKQATNYKESKYTTVSYNELKTAIEATQIVYDNINATQNEIDAAATTLSAAIDALVKSTKCVWKITVDINMTDNDNIGDEWDWGIFYKGEEVFDTFEITAKEGAEITIKGKVVEEDNSPDRGSGSITLELKDGKSKNKTITVKENRGRYAGRKAKWRLEVSCELIERI